MAATSLVIGGHLGSWMMHKPMWWEWHLSFKTSPNSFTLGSFRVKIVTFFVVNCENENTGFQRNVRNCL